MGRSAGGDRRGAHPAHRRGARGLPHPRHQPADRLAVPRQAVDEGGAAGGRHPHRRLGRHRFRRRGACLRRGRRLSADPEAAVGRGGGRHHPGRLRHRAGGGPGDLRRDRCDVGGHRGVRRGTRGLLRHVVDQRRARLRVRLALLPGRAGGHADPLDLTAVRLDQSGGQRGGLPRTEGAGPTGERGAGHRHLGDPHGVVLRSQGTALLRDRLPSVRGRRLGPLRGGQRDRHLRASGQTPSCTDRRRRGRAVGTRPA